jgi:nucleoside-diphosphate-sugar epimerase
VAVRTLVLGGTVFLSRAVAEAARDAGHDVTCLARGVSGSVPDGVRLVRADRAAPGAYQELAGETFDAVVDVANSLTRVRGALVALASRARHWTYVSTCNVYADDATPGQRAATAALREPATEDSDDLEQYGAVNVACEQATARAMGTDRAFLCRPGLIVGPGDTTMRFRYWVNRLAAGGEVLAPGAPDRLVQFVDVRDLARWIVAAGETGLAGGYDGIGAPLPMSDVLTAVAAGVGSTPTYTWVDQEFLSAHEVAPWMGPRSLPLWLPEPEYAGFASRDVSDSLAAGLTTRAIADTARDTLAAEPTAPVPGAHRDAGLTAADEAELLTAWRNVKSSS